LRSRYKWPPRGVPIDPSPQALPDSQFVMLSVHNALNRPSNPKLISGSRRTGSIGELEVPGDHQIPAVPRSPTPSTRPKDPYLVYNQPGHQKEPTNESFPTPPSPSRVLENSSSTTIPSFPDDASRGRSNTAGGKAGKHRRAVARRAHAHARHAQRHLPEHRHRHHQAARIRDIVDGRQEVYCG